MSLRVNLTFLYLFVHSGYSRVLYQVERKQGYLLKNLLFEFHIWTRKDTVQSFTVIKCHGTLGWLFITQLCKDPLFMDSKNQTQAVKGKKINSPPCHSLAVSVSYIIASCQQMLIGSQCAIQGMQIDEVENVDKL